MAGVRTTSRGKCRTCGHSWPVPRTSVEPSNLSNVGEITVVKGLQAVCGRCKSVRISWLLDGQAPSAPTLT